MTSEGADTNDGMTKLKEDENEKKFHSNWELNTSCFSGVFMLWFYPLLKKSLTKQLEIEDLGDVHPQDDPELLYSKFESHWIEGVEKAKRANEQRRKEGKPDDVKPSMVWVMLHMVGHRNILACVMLTVVQSTCGIVLPFISKILIEARSLEDQNVESTLSTVEQWLVVATLTLLPFIAALCQSTVMRISYRASMHMYTVLTIAIFRKSLKLSANSRNEASTGNIVNLMTNDAGGAIERSVILIYPMILAPFQLGILLYLLFDQIGTSMFAGIGFMLVMVPINALIFVKIAGAYKDLMYATDSRVKLVNEVLSTIRVLKMYAWENAFMENIKTARGKELAFLKRHAYWFTIGLSAVFLQLPFLLQAVVFGTFYLQGGLFLPFIIFPAMQYFGQIQQPLTQLPNAINQGSQTYVALNRIKEFLLRDEMIVHDDDTRDEILPEDPNAPLVICENATFSWGTGIETPSTPPSEENKPKKKKKKTDKADAKVETEPVVDDIVVAIQGSPEATLALDNANFKINRGELIAIVGSVGSGKSAFLLSLLGELHKTQGSVRMHGRVSFASQLSWIVNASLKDNVLFGSAFDKNRYSSTLHACALEDDIDMFNGGDEVMIGERGINLSGGQKARINLARAVYSDADIVLLDDPLAAVDAHVGNHIFEKCIRGLLRGKTRLLVTNQTHRLKNVDRIFVMDGGAIQFQGTFRELEASGIDYSAAAPQAHAPNDRVDSSHGPGGATESTREEDTTQEDEVNRREKDADKLYEEEGRQAGTVQFAVLVYYWKTIGYWFVALCLIVNISYLFLPVVGSYIFSLFTDEVSCTIFAAANGTIIANETTVEEFCDAKGGDFWMTLYIAVMSGSFVLCIFGAIAIAEARVKGARVMHENLAETVIRAPVSYFDVTPLGRILNRFSRDIGEVDNQLAQLMLWVVVTLTLGLSSFFGMALSTSGLALVLLIPVALVYNFVYQRARLCGIQIQRFQSTTRSPIYSSFSEVLVGLSTIRAYKHQDRFIYENQRALKRNIVPFFLSRAGLPAWMTVTLNLLGLVIAGGISSFVVGAKDLISGGDAGLALTYSLSVTGVMISTIFVLTAAEVQLNSVERIREYSEGIEPEAPAEIEDTKPEAGWPKRGEIEVSNLRVGYRDGPDVLNGISFVVKPSEKIGCAGRTGSGKSTLWLTLLRMVEPRSGTIRIDGVDISTIGLRDLRSSVGIIPQDAICFIGTIRRNLDPFESFADEEVWAALEKVSLKSFVSTLPNKLDEQVAENGDNLSVGQRQMLSMARAILRKSKILLLDEATASLDSGTDHEIQRMIREVFAEQTVLTIAHRLDTIMDSDRVLVLGRGNILEFEDPKVLMRNPASEFRKMVVEHR